MAEHCEWRCVVNFPVVEYGPNEAGAREFVADMQRYEARLEFRIVSDRQEEASEVGVIAPLHVRKDNLNLLNTVAAALLEYDLRNTPWAGWESADLQAQDKYREFARVAIVAMTKWDERLSGYA